MSLFLLFLLFYILFFYFYANWLYNKNKGYYQILMVKSDENAAPRNIHELYPEFVARDKLSFWRLFIGSMLFFVPKVILCAFISISLNYLIKRQTRLSKKPNEIPEERKKMESIIRFWSYFFAYANGIHIINKNLDYEEVYKKYLGPDYKMDINDKDYSLIICNHIGFFEVVITMAKFQSGFIAKKEIKDYYFIGPIAQGLNCLFINRESSEARYEIFNQLKKHQEDYQNKKTLAPLCLFPEGTTTSGKHILKMKKGAFFSCLPIKPVIVKINQNSDFHLAVGAQNIVYNYLRSLSYLYQDFYFTELPVIKPTEYMFEKYASLGSSQWEIFATVVQKMYCEIGGFSESNKKLIDSKTYQNAMETGKYIIPKEKKE